MNTLTTQLFCAAGWTIIHSLWQFFILYAIFKLILTVIKPTYSNIRYMAGVFFMIAALAISILSFSYEYKAYFANNAPNINTLIKNPNNLIPLNPQPVKNTVYLNLITKTTFVNFLDLISPYLSLGWIAGLSFYTMKIIGGGYYLSRLRRLSSHSFPLIEQEMCSTKNKMKINRMVKLIVSDEITEALTFGHFKPVIVLPLSYIARVPADQLEMILAHELAHIKRYDYLVVIIQTSLEAIFFFNPFFKLLSRDIKDEREYCCDDMATKYCGNPETMAIALAGVKILQSYPMLSLSASASKTNFQTRIQRLIAHNARPDVPVKTILLPLITIVLGVLAFTKYNNNHDRKPVKAIATLTKQTEISVMKTAVVVPGTNHATRNPKVSTLPVSAMRNIAKSDTDTSLQKKPVVPNEASTVSHDNRVLPPHATLYMTDTVEYSPRGYNVAPNSSLNVLIGKMEGFKIDSTGRVFHQGMELNRFAVNGNLIAGQKLPANITASMVRVIQVCYGAKAAANHSGTMNIQLKTN